MSSKSIRLAIADDHNMIRKAWILLLGELENVTVIGEAANGRELIQLLETKPVDIVLMDIDMPLMNGLEAAEIIRNRCPWVKIIALTMQKDFSFVKKLFAMGAMGYVTKNASKEELFAAIQAVSEGRKFVCDELNDSLLRKIGLERLASQDDDILTRREKEIVRLIADGMTSRDIAQHLFLSLKTVEAHRGNVFRKFKVKNVAELLKKAREHSLI
jgi:DNA-binding NarL/FixJ family response regulator